MAELTDLLNRAMVDERALAEVIDQLEGSIRERASRMIRKGPHDPLLQVSDLMSIALRRIFQGKPFVWTDRQHFYRIIWGTMKRVRIDALRRSQAQKRHGRNLPILLENDVPAGDPVDDVAWEDLLDQLEKRKGKLAALVVRYRTQGFRLKEIPEELLQDHQIHCTEHQVRYAWLQGADWLAPRI